MKFTEKLRRMETLLTLKETAELLRITVKTVRRWAESGRIPAKNIGSGASGDWRIDPVALADWFDAAPLSPEAVATILAAPNGRVQEQANGSLEVNVGWPEAR